MYFSLYKKSDIKINRKAGGNPWSAAQTRRAGGAGSLLPSNKFYAWLHTALPKSNSDPTALFHALCAALYARPSNPLLSQWEKETDPPPPLLWSRGASAVWLLADNVSSAPSRVTLRDLFPDRGSGTTWRFQGRFPDGWDCASSGGDGKLNRCA